MLSKPPSCKGCPLELSGAGWVPSAGGGKILLVGEAPGETEAESGKPFVGMAGWMLNRIISRIGLDRSVMGVHNCLSCRPPKNWLAGAPWEYAALAKCAPNLDATIERLKPKVIVALGNVALRQLTGRSGVSQLRGYPLMGPKGIWVVPTYHPSFLLPRAGQKDTSRLQSAVMLDLKMAEKIAEVGFRYDTPELILDPDPGAFEGYVSQAIAAGLPLSVDIETPGKIAKDEEDLAEGGWNNTIIRIGFAYEANRGCSIPFLPPYRKSVERLLAASMPKVLWNGYAFDWPILETHGLLLGGDVHDGMWAWKFLQSDLPRGLQSVGSFYAAEIGPWKYLSSTEPAKYNALDAIVALRNFEGIRKDLEAQGRWDRYEVHTRKCWIALRQAGLKNGLLMHGEGREVLKAKLEEISIEHLLRAQRVVPLEFHASKTYARKPLHIPTEEIQVLGTEKYCPACGKSGKLNGKHPCGVEKLESRPKEITVYQTKVDWKTFAPASLQDLEHHIELGGFNPSSEKQMKVYARAFKHPLRFDSRKGSDSLDKSQLEKLAAKKGKDHPIYTILQDLRGVSKTLGTYVNGFQPDAAGKIYTSYTYVASTGRLTSRAVNLQNVSHRSENEWAEHIRRMIVPRAGRVFVEADSSAIEAVLVGYFAGDPDYMARAKLGIHAFLACAELGLDFNPENVKLVKGESRFETLYARKKRTVHGVNFGMGAGLMAMNYPKVFPSKKAAQKEIDFYYSVCPKLKDWHDFTQLLAHRQAYLENPFGYRHYFFDVLKKNPAGATVLGSDAKRVLAFLPQSTAAAFMRENIAALVDSRWYPEALPANLTCHDALLLEPLVDEAEAARDYLLDLMNRPIPELGGLRIGVEVKLYTDNWQDSKKFGGRD
jgi:uracil-DNA glycosylase family 4